MNISEHMDQLVAEFSSHETAKEAILQLSKANIDVNNLSIIGRDYHTEEQPVGYINTGDRMLSWGKFGAFWGSIWGILFGSAILFVPGVGAVMVGGWLVSTLASAVEGAVLGGGFAAIGGALSTVGVPKDSVIAYEEAIKAGNFIVVVRGSAEEVLRAKAILANLGATGLEISGHRVLTHA